MKSALYIGGFKLPDKNAAAHRVINVGKILIEMSYEVSFLGFRDSDLNLGIIKETKVMNLFENWSIPYPGGFKRWVDYILNPAEAIEIANDMKNIDLIVCYNYPAVSSLILRRYAKKKGIKIISDCTEWYSVEIKSIRDLVKWIDSEIRMRLVNPSLDGVICISSYLEKYYTSSHTILLPPLVDLEEKKWEKVPDSNDEVLRLIYAGSPGVSKDKLDLVIRLVTRLPESLKVKLDIIGLTLDEYYKVNETSKNKNSNLSERICFHGRMSHKAVMEKLKKSSYSVFFRDNIRSNEAGFPTKFVESVSAGVPVITNESSDVGGYIEKFGLGHLMNLSNEDECFKCFEKIVSMNSKDYKTLRANCEKFDGFDHRRYMELFGEFVSKL